jgi:hypothetical protein
MSNFGILATPFLSPEAMHSLPHSEDFKTLAILKEALVALRISNEDTLLHVCSKAPKRLLVLLNQNIGSTAPNT